MGRKLKRSRSDKVIAGVCGGIGEYFNIDPVIVRIVWVLLAFMPGGPGFLAYLICALIIPEDDGVIYQEDSEVTKGNTVLFIGLALTLAGGLMLAKVILPQFTFRLMRVGRYWPVLLIVFGLYIIFGQLKRK